MSTDWYDFYDAFVVLRGYRDCFEERISSLCASIAQSPITWASMKM